MVSVRTLKLMWWTALISSVLPCVVVPLSNVRLTGRVGTTEPVVSQVVRDGWMDAARMGAPIYRTEGGPVSLPLLPAGKAIVVSGKGYALATDDLADVQRWYGLLTYPVLDMSAFPAVHYVYEVEAAELVIDAEGRKVLAVTIHEARTGCELPACDPVTQLPNFDRRYVVKPANTVVAPAGVNNA